MSAQLFERQDGGDVGLAAADRGDADEAPAGDVRLAERTEVRDVAEVAPPFALAPPNPFLLSESDDFEWKKALALPNPFFFSVSPAVLRGKKHLR